nr:MAG TPA: hypothetical protein [Caudoviricetes sp.]
MNVLSRSGNIPRYRKDGDKLLVSCLWVLLVVC